VRGALGWVLAIVAGIVVVIGVSAAIGARDDSEETVSAGRWAQSVCAAVGVWRGTTEAIVEDIRTPPSTGASGVEEPQSETPQGRTGFVRTGLERAVRAADTMVEGIERAGVPDTPQGDEAAKQVSDWADSAQTDLEAAQDSLDEEADSLEESIDQLTSAAGAIGSTLTEGAKTLAEVAKLDAELAQALAQSSTCQQLREEQDNS
jgi:hypothetical protein